MECLIFIAGIATGVVVGGGLVLYRVVKILHESNGEEFYDSFLSDCSHSFKVELKEALENYLWLK